MHATARKPNNNSFIGDIRIFNIEGEEKVRIEGLMCASIGKKGGKSDETNAKKWNEVLYETVWKEDVLSVIEKEQLNGIVSGTEKKWNDEPDQLALGYMRNVVEVFSKDAALKAKITPMYQKLYSWIEEAVEKNKEKQICSLPSVLDEEAEKTMTDENLIMNRVGFNLANIMIGATDPLSVVFKDDTIYKVYEKGPTFYEANQVLTKILDLLAHKKGDIKVLEIGAGTQSRFYS